MSSDDETADSPASNPPAAVPDAARRLAVALGTADEDTAEAGGGVVTVGPATA